MWGEHLSALILEVLQIKAAVVCRYRTDSKLCIELEQWMIE